MSRLKLRYLRSIAELRDRATQWDRLWERSDVAAPTARAEFVCQWITHFAPDANFLGLVVEDRDTFVAALPLVAARTRGFHCGRIPSNAWGVCGDLLVDGTDEQDATLHRLAEGLNAAPWPLMWMTPVAFEASRWRNLVAAARDHGLAVMTVDSQRVGQVRIAGDWNDYQATWSGNHRRHLRKAMKRAGPAGELTLDVYRDLSPNDLQVLLRRGCEIEDRSWKGAAGTSILRAPTMFEWYFRQASQMSDYGHLQLTFLRHGGQSIAFEYGYCAKGTYFSSKVGYDADYAAFSPGQLLRAMLLERFFSMGEVSVVDFWGPLSDATAKWATTSYPVGKILIAPRRFLSRLALAGYSTLRSLRNFSRPTSIATFIASDEYVREHA